MWKNVLDVFDKNALASRVCALLECLQTAQYYNNNIRKPLPLTTTQPTEGIYAITSELNIATDCIVFSTHRLRSDDVIISLRTKALTYTRMMPYVTVSGILNDLIPPNIFVDEKAIALLEETKRIFRDASIRTSDLSATVAAEMLKEFIDRCSPSSTAEKNENFSIESRCMAAYYMCKHLKCLTDSNKVPLDTMTLSETKVDKYLFNAFTGVVGFADDFKKSTSLLRAYAAIMECITKENTYDSQLSLLLETMKKQAHHNVALRDQVHDIASNGFIVANCNYKLPLSNTHWTIVSNLHHANIRRIVCNVDEVKGDTANCFYLGMSQFEILIFVANAMIIDPVIVEPVASDGETTAIVTAIGNDVDDDDDDPRSRPSSNLRNRRRFSPLYIIAGLGAAVGGYAVYYKLSKHSKWTTERDGEGATTQRR